MTRPPPSVNDLTRMLADVPKDDSPLHQPPPEIELPQLREYNRLLREQLKRAMYIVREVNNSPVSVKRKMGLTVGALEEAERVCGVDNALRVRGVL